MPGLAEYNVPDGHRDPEEDPPNCDVCGTEMEPGDGDCDPDSGKQWKTYLCPNGLCVESPYFPAEDWTEER